MTSAKAQIALFTPLSPQRSGLVEHIETLLPYLAQRLTITVVTSGEYRIDRSVRSLCRASDIALVDYAEFEKDPSQFGLPVYQLGNHGAIHGYMYSAIHKYPGVVLLHDLTLCHGIVGAYLDAGTPQEFVDEMRYAYGRQGASHAEQLLAGKVELDHSVPLIERILDDSLAVIGFNSYVRDWLERNSPGLRAAWLPLHAAYPAGFPPRFDPSRFRERLGLADAPLVATLGLYNPNNRLDVALRAFGRVLEDMPDARYILVGEPLDRSQVEREISHLGLQDSVRLTGWVSSVDFQRYLMIPDVAIQLRYPHAGGTSYNPIRLAAAGVPTIISRIPPMQDIPDDVMIRVEPEADDEEDQLHDALHRLIADVEYRHSIGERARAFVVENHTPERVAENLSRFICEVMEDRSLLEEQALSRFCPRAAALGLEGILTEQTASAINSLGLSSGTPQLYRPIADAISKLSQPWDKGERKA